MAALEELEGATWVRLGDRDLATHIKRRQLLAAGNTLSAATRLLWEAAGLDTNVWPMSDDPVRTHINTDSEVLDFQDYFVRKKAEPVARSISYAGSGQASASPGALAALNSEDLAAIFISPSNPWLSIDPILSLSDIESTIISNSAPVVAVSPIVGGRAIKGPTAKLMREFNLDVSALSIAEHYKEFLDGLIIDRQDEAEREAIESLGIKVATTNTIMNTPEEKKALAQFALEFAGEIRIHKTGDCIS
jgi:LPPG:FO 2-phospho-L-lactate transferase